jgi:putative DNA primase/helicase
MTHLGPEAGAPLTAEEREVLGRADGARDENEICIMPVPIDAGECNLQLPGRGRADVAHEYRDGASALLGYVLRWEKTQGANKEFRPATYWRNGKDAGAWRKKIWPAPRPLYGLDRLAKNPDAVVLLCEGEKAADAVGNGPLAGAFIWASKPVIGMTWPGGSEAVHKADFRPLAGRDVIVVPDHDAAGEGAADKLVSALGKIGAKVRRWRAPGECPAKWDLADLPPSGLTDDQIVESILNAPEAAPQSADSSDEENIRESAAAEQQAEAETAPPFTEEAIALDCARRHAESLRYVAAWSRWLRWSGRHWAPDDTLFAFDLARKLCRSFTEQPKAPIARLTSAKTVASVVTLARADRRLAATVDQWDADPWQVNTPGGVVDLRTGKLRAAEPTDYMTKITGCAPGGDCPRWRKFLARVTDGDADLQDFLKRLVGYALTGCTQEHGLFFLYGLGANGKSVFIVTVSGILGQYHRTTPIETFTASNVDRHPTELADLRGARLVSAVETEEGRRWAESKIKSLTGGDKISARFMRQDFFEFTPQFKLLIAGNHKPGLRSVDEAIRRRFHLVPFSVIIPAAERDSQLTEKLQREWPGILQWAIDGCLEWQRVGLRPPKAVTAATEAYLEAEDALVTWMDECGERDPSAWQSRTQLYASWIGWAEKNGEYAGSRKRFLQNLETRGLTPARSPGHKSARGFRGLRLFSQYEQE